MKTFQITVIQSKKKKNFQNIPPLRTFSNVTHHFPDNSWSFHCVLWCINSRNPYTEIKRYHYQVLNPLYYSVFSFLIYLQLHGFFPNSAFGIRSSVIRKLLLTHIQHSGQQTCLRLIIARISVFIWKLFITRDNRVPVCKHFYIFVEEIGWSKAINYFNKHVHNTQLKTFSSTVLGTHKWYKDMT